MRVRSSRASLSSSPISSMWNASDAISASSLSLGMLLCSDFGVLQAFLPQAHEDFHADLVHRWANSCHLCKMLLHGV